MREPLRNPDVRSMVSAQVTAHTSEATPRTDEACGAFPGSGGILPATGCRPVIVQADKMPAYRVFLGVPEGIAIFS